ncbi:hypothetical protein [Ruminococcus flavefaciens]|nr:hypothetical protein [Ruminococcus flavefaciens]
MNDYEVTPRQRTKCEVRRSPVRRWTSAVTSPQQTLSESATVSTWG